MLARTAVGLALALSVVGCGDTKPKSHGQPSAGESSDAARDVATSPAERPSLPSPAANGSAGPRPRLALPPAIEKAKRHINKRRGPLPHYQITTDDDGLAKTFQVGKDGSRSRIEQ